MSSVSSGLAGLHMEGELWEPIVVLNVYWWGILSQLWGPHMLVHPEYRKSGNKVKAVGPVIAGCRPDLGRTERRSALGLVPGSSPSGSGL